MPRRISIPLSTSLIVTADQGSETQGFNLVELRDLETNNTVYMDREQASELIDALNSAIYALNHPDDVIWPEPKLVLTSEQED